MGLGHYQRSPERDTRDEPFVPQRVSFVKRLAHQSENPDSSAWVRNPNTRVCLQALGTFRLGNIRDRIWMPLFRHNPGAFAFTPVAYLGGGRVWNWIEIRNSYSNSNLNGLRLRTVFNESLFQKVYQSKVEDVKSSWHGVGIAVRFVLVCLELCFGGCFCFSCINYCYIADGAGYRWSLGHKEGKRTRY